MGHWSRLVGEVFLDWLAPATQLRWVDVGCGNGAFSQLVFDRCDPAHLTGLDPSEGQLAYARSRLSGRDAKFIRGDAMDLPFDDGSFDIAAMALVIFFVPIPRTGVGEMARVVPAGRLGRDLWMGHHGRRLADGTNIQRIAQARGEPAADAQSGPRSPGRPGRRFGPSMSPGRAPMAL